MKGLSKITGLMLIFLGAPLLASAQPQLSLDSATGQKGGTASMTLSLSGGTENYAGVNAKIVLPEGVTLSGVTQGALLSTGFTIDSHGPSGTVIAYSDTGVFSASSGVLLTLDLYIGSEVAPGNYDVGFANSDEISLVNSENALSNADGSVSVPNDTYAASNNLVIKTGSLTLATVVTTAVSAVTSSSATCGGNVTSNGGAPVTAKGVCWSSSANPTTSNNKTTDGSGSGSFSSSLTGLSSGTTYHVRAYAINSFGIAYGGDVNFKTDISTLYVSANGNCGGKTPCYKSIQEVISVAGSGSVIKLLQGTYSQAFVLNDSKALTIKGGWNSSFTTQTSNMTFIKAPKTTQGSLTLQMVTIKP